MKCKINVKMDNAAFGDEPLVELARILRVLADRLEEEFVGYFDGVYLFDLNGNVVGEINIK